jgi:hypothetical protein
MEADPDTAGDGLLAVDLASLEDPRLALSGLRGIVVVNEVQRHAELRAMRATASVLLVVLAALVGACSSVRTRSDFDPGADFSAWRTYAWYPGGPPASGDLRLDNSLIHSRVEAAVDHTLGVRGFTQVRDRTPDFYVNFHLSTEQRLDVRDMNRVYFGGPHGRHWRGAGWGGVGWTETVVDQYEAGTLVIDLVDVSLRRLVWRGSGTRRLSTNPQPDRITRRVNEAVDEILSRFPPSQ